MTVAVAPQSWDNYKRVPPAHQAAMTGWVVVCEAWCGAMIHDVVVVVVAVWGVANGAVEPWRGSCIGSHRQRSGSDGRWYGGYKWRACRRYAYSVILWGLCGVMWGGVVSFC